MAGISTIDTSSFLATLGNISFNDVIGVSVPEQVKWGVKNGVRGSIARYRIDGSENVEITLTVPPGSDTNNVLSAIAQADTLTGGGVVFDLTLVSTDGRITLRAPAAYISACPALELNADEPADLEWRIQTCGLQRSTRAVVTQTIADIAGLI